MIKVLIIEPVLAHYRKDLYSKYFQSKDFNFKILAGRQYQNIQSIKMEGCDALKYISIPFFNHKFYFLLRSIRYIINYNPNIIICSGVDFHLIHTIFIYFYFHRIKKNDFYWWSHANYGNQGIIGKYIRKYFYKASSGIFTYSDKGKKNLINIGINNNVIQIMGNALNREDYGFLNYNILQLKKENPFTILFCGRFTKAKKLSILLQALSYIKKKYDFRIKCIIVGDGNILYYRELTRKLDIADMVLFTGPKYYKETHEYYLSSDLFIIPGSIGLSLLHALSFGLPVITSDNYNSHSPEIELLIPGKIGDVFEDKNYKELVQKILLWKKKISHSRLEIKKHCIERIKELEYLPEMTSKKVIDFLKKNSGD